MILFTSDRYFTIFDFHISHSQLLLRSSKGEKHQSNVDVIFFNVKFLQTPVSLWGISIEEIAESDAQLLELKHQFGEIEYKASRVYSVTTKKKEFYVICSFIKIFENQLEFDQTSLGVLNPIGREVELKLDAGGS
jgi:hypothetical protein